MGIPKIAPSVNPKIKDISNGLGGSCIEEAEPHPTLTKIMASEQVLPQSTQKLKILPLDWEPENYKYCYRVNLLENNMYIPEQVSP